MKEKLIIIVIIGILLLTSSSSLSAIGKNVKTERCNIQTTGKISSLSNGNTFYVGGSGSGNYSNIQDAINSASPGDTVYIYDDSSPYYENIIVDKTLNLIGENKDTTVIDGSQGRGEDAIYISAEKVNISGFLIRNSIPNGIAIDSKYNNISGNNIFANLIGIICNTNENMISGNNISSNLVWGIFFVEGANNNIVLDNIISLNYMGIESSGSYNTFSDNIITFNEGYGIRLNPCSDNTISGNLFSNNVLGIWFDSSNNLVYNNNFLNNEEGVFIRSSENNMFYHNNFIGNTDGNAEEFYCINTIWDDGYSSGGNYWDDYTGKDRGDGIGDTPYYIPDEDGRRNSDRYPLMKARGKEDNLPPAIPELSGSTSGKIRQEYTYTTITTDPESDKVRYCFDWGDGTKTWTDYNESSETVNVIHTWAKQGNYEIKVKARDIYGYESTWSDPLPISMPRNRATNTPLFNFLEQHPNLFPLLRLLQNLPAFQ